MNKKLGLHIHLWKWFYMVGQGNKFIRIIQ